jgi:two-component system, cell cycle sensor histidine kinase and response regulator CckA
MQGKQATILVVEDEMPHLAFLKKTFEKAGYSVLTAIDGVDAIDTYKRQQKAIDVVLCDMALPSLGGWTVYLSLKEIDPGVKMILTSGYLDEQVKPSFVEGGVKDFIVKPYAVETLLQTVRQALEA